MPVYLLLKYREVTLNLLRVQYVSLLVMQVSQFLCLWDANAETILVRNGLCLSICIADVRQFPIAATTRQ